MGDVNYNIAKLPLYTRDTRKYSQINDIYDMCQINKSEYTRVTLECSSLVDHNHVNNLPRQGKLFWCFTQCFTSVFYESGKLR